MSASTVSFTDYTYRQANASALMNSKLNALKSAVNNHAAFIDILLVGGPGIFDVRQYGAVGDGVADDTSAIQSAINAAVVAGGGVVSFKAGIYRITAPLSLVEVRDIAFFGAGRFSTIIRQVTANTPVIQVNGLWYSRFEGLRFETSASQVGNGVFELDGNYDGTHHMGVQGNTFKDCYFAGNASTVDYLFTVVRQGGGAGQGSENLFLNCHFEGAKLACFTQAGLNALNNTFIGGNFQAFAKHGILAAGGINLYSVAFQSTYQYAQILNGGFDVVLVNSAGDRVTIDGCRTESMRFLLSDFSHDTSVTQLTHTPSIANWAATHAFVLDDTVQGVTATGELKMYRITTAGTTAGVVPVWPASGTVADGSVVWTQTNFNVIDVARGSISRSSIICGQIVATNKCEVRGVAFRRLDPLAGSYVVGADAPVVYGCYYESSLSGAITPFRYGTATALTQISAMDVGEGALTASSGNSGASFKTIAQYRGHGNSSFPILNWWAQIGGVQSQSFVFADFAFATAANGVVPGLMLFCSDGTPGDPLAGGGTGCFAYFANNRWKGI